MLQRRHTRDVGQLARFLSVRQATVALAAPLSPEDCCAQSMPDASPVKWHLAHTTWFFETFVLERFEPNFQPFDASFRVLFNSYYNGVGAKHPRAQRGLITRPDLAEVLRYREHVDGRMRRLLECSGQREWQTIVELGLNHEQQHQELMLTDLKHLLSCNPAWPAYVPARGLAEAVAPVQRPRRWHTHAGGLVEIGHAGDGFCFDNELPRHKVYLEPFELADRLVTNGEFLAFMEAGGYQDPALWLSEGWDWIGANRVRAPLYWRQPEAGADWQEFTLHGAQTLVPEQPVVHLSYFEADAFARWAQARLPTEAEWEAVAQSLSQEQDAPLPQSAGLHPQVQTDASSLLGGVWQWTRSSYDAYPGFQPAAGAVGEYNGKFMVNQYVLRGGSCATPRGHVRASYRNFFPTAARWQFTGLRLCR